MSPTLSNRPFRFMSCFFLLFTSHSARAAQIHLSPDQIGNRIAIPYELELHVTSRQIPNEEKEGALENYAKSQAQFNVEGELTSFKNSTTDPEGKTGP